MHHKPDKSFKEDKNIDLRGFLNSIYKCVFLLQYNRKALDFDNLSDFREKLKTVFATNF